MADVSGIMTGGQTAPQMEVTMCRGFTLIELLVVIAIM